MNSTVLLTVGSALQIPDKQTLNPQASVLMNFWKERICQWKLAQEDISYRSNYQRKLDQMNESSSLDEGNESSPQEVAWDQFEKDEELRQPLSRKVSITSSKISPYRVVVVFRLVALAFFFQFRLVNPVENAYWLWLTSVICEVWFALSWILDQLSKWQPVNGERQYEEFKSSNQCSLVAKFQNMPCDGWSMQDGTQWPGNNTRDHPGMIQILLSRGGPSDAEGRHAMSSFPRDLMGVDGSGRFANHNTIFYDNQGVCVSWRESAGDRLSCKLDSMAPDENCLSDVEANSLEIENPSCFVDLKKCFGPSSTLIASIIVKDNRFSISARPGGFLKRSNSCDKLLEYEDNTAWGREIGWIYGSLNSDIVTGLEMHTARMEVNLLHCPIWYGYGGKLRLLQRIAYINATIYPLTSIPMVIYCTIPAICLITGRFIIPMISRFGSIWFLLTFSSIFCYWCS
ncbi:hypothetical protein J5N97_014225 [Dioscorea zingiberensis]|uniref:Uncharacterized protein n=1 Tax=Dioscorea zingiberensis TaxID=325984 RepID=A0A9D5HJI3_9LILI|nr:hypothetical protein J5N97_014225 [Dioscorea zingiberensis]